MRPPDPRLLQVSFPLEEIRSFFDHTVVLTVVIDHYSTARCNTMSSRPSPTLRVTKGGDVQISWRQDEDPRALNFDEEQDVAAAAPSSSSAAASSSAPGSPPAAPLTRAAARPRNTAMGGQDPPWEERYEALHRTFTKGMLKLQRASSELKQQRLRVATLQKDLHAQKRRAEAAVESKNAVAVELASQKEYAKKVEGRLVQGTTGKYLAEKNESLRKLLREARAELKKLREATVGNDARLRELELDNRALKGAVAMRAEELSAGPAPGPAGASDFRENLLFNLAKSRCVRTGRLGFVRARVATNWLVGFVVHCCLGSCLVHALS